MWCPIALEFEIVSGATDSVITPTAGGTITPSNTSTSSQLQDVRVVADAVTLDTGLQHSYAEHVLSGKSHPISYSTHIAIVQRCAFPAMNVSVARAASRLKTVFSILMGSTQLAQMISLVFIKIGAASSIQCKVHIPLTMS